MQKSLMPKGVDHLGLPTDGVADAVVQKSLMPKGVDHDNNPPSADKTIGGAKIFDAERR